MSAVAETEPMKDNFPLMIDFNSFRMVRRVETDSTFFFEVCAVPGDIRALNNEVFRSLRSLRDRLACYQINDIRLDRRTPADQYSLEREFQLQLQRELVEAHHIASDRMAVLTGAGEIFSLSLFALAVKPLAKIPSLRTLTLVFGSISQIGTLFAASSTSKLWIHVPPRILDSSARQPIPTANQLYELPEKKYALDNTLFDTYVKALDTATRNLRRPQ